MNNKKWIALIVLMSSLFLSGCTTCDLSLWFGADLCEIGGM